MRRPRLLDLFCCEGGAGEGYRRAGFDVVGVDVEPRDYRPGEFVRADAIEFAILDPGEFDAVHASPPCQTHSTLTKGNRRRDGWDDEHRDWITETRSVLDWWGLPYVIENVPSSPLRRDVVLCGEMFGLGVIRHRVFELGGWTAIQPEHRRHRGRVSGWRHGERFDGPYVAVYGDGGGKGNVADWQTAMGIDWITDKAALAEAIPPIYTETLGRQLLAVVTERITA